MARRKVLFLSTPSARRATLHGHEQRVGVVISIHALREEGDDVRQASPLTVCLFLSTPSARRATYCFFNKFFFKVISIHALREEGDNRQLLQTSSVFHYFYPRPPRGGRLLMGLLFIERSLFLSTPSARRATAAGCSASSTTTDFYPRPPRGGRPRYIPTLSVDSVFLSTPSARRATRSGARPQQLRHISIHALREEGDLLRRRRKPRSRDFYPRPPRGGRPAAA